VAFVAIHGSVYDRFREGSNSPGGQCSRRERRRTPRTVLRRSLPFHDGGFG